MVVDTGTGTGIYEKKIQKVIVGFRAKYKLGCQRGACSRSKGKGKDTPRDKGPELFGACSVNYNFMNDPST